MVDFVPLGTLSGPGAPDPDLARFYIKVTPMEHPWNSQKSLKFLLKLYLKHVLKLVLIFIDVSSPRGACRPGFARETERASAKSCDSHGLSNDSGANNGLLIILMILRRIMAISR